MKDNGIRLKKNVSRHGQLTAVSMMKDEAPYLLEWFAHHMAVGFTDIVVFTNDCSDGTADMLIRLQELGLGHHRVNTIADGKKPQPSAIKHAQEDPVVQASDWVLVFDADEFLCIRQGDGSLDSMIDAAGNANGIVITWRIFGSSSVTDWRRTPVTEQYTHAAPPMWNKGWGVKTLFKFDAEYWKLGIHRPKMKNKHIEKGYPDSVHWLNGSGLPMEEYFKFRGWRSIRRTIGYDWAQMNHYAVKSVDSYALRRFRGNVNNKPNKYNADYWALQDRNEIEDTTILRYSKKRAAIMSKLLQDPVLNKLHYAALDRVEQRLKEFKATKEYKEFKSGLIEASQIPITKLDAKPAKARDPAKIAALMSDVEKKQVAGRAKPGAGPSNEISRRSLADPYLTGKLDRSTNVPFETAENHGVLLPADPRVFNADALEAVAKGKFDRRRARTLTRYLRADDRLLHLGGGIGFLSVLACKTHPKLLALSQDGRDELCQIAAEVAQTNLGKGASNWSCHSGVVAPKSKTAKQSKALQDITATFAPSVLLNTDAKLSYVALAHAAKAATVRRVLITTTDRKDADQTVSAFSAAGFGPNTAGENAEFAVFDRK